MASIRMIAGTPVIFSLRTGSPLRFHHATSAASCMISTSCFTSLDRFFQHRFASFNSMLHVAFAILFLLGCQALVDEGATHICEACPAGQQQLGAGAVSCNACPAGTSKAVKSTEECAPCSAGTWARVVMCSKNVYVLRLPFLCFEMRKI